MYHALIVTTGYLIYKNRVMAWDGRWGQTMDKQLSHGTNNGQTIITWDKQWTNNG
jgi:hypothetical protein